MWRVVNRRMIGVIDVNSNNGGVWRVVNRRMIGVIDAKISCTMKEGEIDCRRLIEVRTEGWRSM